MKEMVVAGGDADEKGEKITRRKLEAHDTRTQKRKLP